MILLINPNGNNATTAAMAAILAPRLPPLACWTAPGGPPVILTPVQLRAAARQVAGISPPPGCRGAIVAAFGDPGAALLAKRLQVPVLGIGAAAAREAGIGGRPFAVVTTTPELAPQIDRLMRRHGGVSYRGCVLTAGRATDLMADPDALDQALLAGVATAAQAGAAAAIIGGGPLAEAALRIAARAPLPLIHPLHAAARQMQALLARP